MRRLKQRCRASLPPTASAHDGTRHSPGGAQQSGRSVPAGAPNLWCQGPRRAVRLPSGGAQTGWLLLARASPGGTRPPLLHAIPGRHGAATTVLRAIAVSARGVPRQPGSSAAEGGGNESSGQSHQPLHAGLRCSLSLRGHGTLPRPWEEKTKEGDATVNDAHPEHRPTTGHGKLRSLRRGAGSWGSEHSVLLEPEGAPAHCECRA